MSAGFTSVQRFMRESTGIALDDDKHYLVENQLRTILREAKLTGFDDLARCLHGDPRSELARSVTDSLTINETSFFRDRSLFDAISERILPRLIALRKSKRRLRIWCAGCSTGQEPYSLAMLIDEQTRYLSGWNVEIVATDLSRPVIESARRGVYSQFEVQRGLPVRMLLRYFTRQDESWRINEYLRERVSFRTQNLMVSFKDLGQFDIVFCRNVLIYFDVATKRAVLGNLSGALADDGFLALGAAERVGGLSDAFHPVPEEPFLFVKSKIIAS